MKRILILASVASMIAQFNMPNIELLQNMGYDVDVACNFEKGNTCSEESIENLKEELKRRKVRYYQIDFARNITDVLSNVKALQKTTCLMKKNKYMFVHCHSPIGGVAGRIGGYFTKTKVIYTAHGFHFYKGAPLKNWLIYYPIEKYLSRYTDVLITINHEDYERAQKKFHSHKVEYVPGVGIDINKFQIPPNIHNESSPKLRLELGIPLNAIVLLSVGELNRNKNHKVVINALPHLKNCWYVVCGKGPLMETYKKMASSLGVSNRVILTGYRTDITNFYQMADIFVFPSKREGLPFSLMEAMANNLPAIVSNIRGNRDLIHNKAGGFLLSPTSVKDFAKAIQTLSKNSSLRQMMGAYNADIVKKYSLEYVMNRIQEIYFEEIEL